MEGQRRPDTTNTLSRHDQYSWLDRGALTHLGGPLRVRGLSQRVDVALGTTVNGDRPH